MNKKKFYEYCTRARQCMEKATEVNDPEVRGWLEDAAAHCALLARRESEQLGEVTYEES